MQYTENQKKAIFTKNKSLLLSAAAGSGKTAVLVQRIIEHVCCDDGCDIDKLLVVTFTDLAASEMRERIYKELNNRLKTDPTNRKLKKQILLLSSSNIRTIHSFCLDVIKTNIGVLSIPANFKIADELQVSILKNKCINELLEDYYEKDDLEFQSLLDTYGHGKDDHKIIEIIMSIYNFSMSLADPESFFDLCVANYEKISKSFADTIFAQILLDRLAEILLDYKNKYKIALTEIDNRPDLLCYKDLFTYEFMQIQNLLEIRDYKTVIELVMEFNFDRIPSVKKGTDNKSIKGIRDNFKEELKKYRELVPISVNVEENDALPILEYIKTIIKLTKEFKERYVNEKLKKAVIDFQDFEHFALQILKNEEISNSYKQTFYEILIDEYQDTNDIQDKIFERIKNEDNLFMVGDVKQCIYKFRQAKPELFIEKAKKYHTATKEVIYLSNNFRSRRQVLDSCNQIFMDLLPNYENEKLIYSANFSEDDGYETEILLFDKSEELIDTEDEIVDLNNEGKMISKKIIELREKDPNMQYSDIVILLRSQSSIGQEFYDTLTEYGLPVSADFSESLYDSIEIRLIISLLKAIDNPLDDISLLALIRSPIFHFSEDELLVLRELDTYSPLYYALAKSDTEKAKDSILFLNTCVKIASTKSLVYLITYVYKITKIKEIFSIYKDSDQRIFNLETFQTVATNYIKTNYFGLKEFIYYIENAQNSEKKISQIKENTLSNSIRIMSIHKSKGLEFPIVFVAGLGKRFNNSDITKKVVVHPDLGLATDYIHKEMRFSYQTLTKNAFKVKIKNELIEEELRVLYVALTRAQEKLFLTATLNNFDKSYDKWQNIKELGGITKNALYNLNTFIDYIMPNMLNMNISKTTVNDIKKTIHIQKHNEDEKLYHLEPIFYDYKYTPLSQIPAKITVTAANKLKQEDGAQNLYVTELDQIESRFSGSEYGLYFHYLFSLIDINLLKKGNHLKDIVEQLIDQKLILKEEYTTDVIEKISNFIKSEIGLQMLNADAVYREKPFLVFIAANEIYDTSFTNEIMLQGTTDCYFTKNNEITLLDFKTDKNTDMDYIKKSYAEQIKLYTYAIEKICGLRVKNKYIYLTNNNTFIKM